MLIYYTAINVFCQYFYLKSLKKISAGAEKALMKRYGNKMPAAAYNKINFAQEGAHLLTTLIKAILIIAIPVTLIVYACLLVGSRSEDSASDSHGR